MREFGRRDQGRVLDLHALVVSLVAGLEAAEDGDRVLDTRLTHHHRLEAPLQGCVFFDVFAILVERRRTDAPQFPAGQRRLEQVGGVRPALRRPGADHGMELIDEEDDVASGRLDLAEDRLEPVFELAAVFRAGDQRAQVERDDAAAAEILGHVGLHDPQGQTLRDRRLAHAGLADEHGIVFGAAGEHLDHPPDFGVAADHGIEFALAGPFCQIDAVLLERLKLLLRILVGHPRLAADRLQPGEQFLLADRRQLEQVFCLRRHFREGQEQVVGGDELVLHLVRLGRRRLENLDQLLISLRLNSARHLRVV